MTERTQRRLAAIVSADVVGYSRLMGADEAGTLAAMRAHRTELWNPLIEQYGGRVVGTAGDSLLIEYASAVAAVESSVAVQRGMIERNADVPENRHMLLRIGVNIGEVVIDGDDIFGDGINVAARLQAIADSGGIAISGNIHEQVSGKLNVAFSDDGEHEVKNIDRPVRVWRWSPKAQITAGDTAGADQLLPLPDKPSIAVLPFDNMSGDPEQEYFSDGMTEDIITELSRFRNFHVIARNSTFTYKGQAVDIKKVGQELGVRYVLEGSVRKAGSRVRITAQLIEAATSKHVWAERYDRELIDIFDLQDEITGTIASAVLPAFETAELRRIDHVRPENLDAWELTLQASYQNNKGTRKGFAAARELVERAITIDPHNVQALALLSYCITWQVVMSYSTSPEEDMEKGIAGARRALELDPSNAVALRSLSGHLLLSWRHDEALEAAEQCVEQNANFDQGWMVYATVLVYCGRFDEAVKAYERGAILNPRNPSMGLWTVQMSMGAFIVQRYEDGVTYGRRAARQLPTYHGCHRILAANLSASGHMEEAASAIAEVIRLSPHQTAADTLRTVPIRADEAAERYCRELVRAGLPEE